jgi:hypothetical protein
LLHGATAIVPFGLVGASLVAPEVEVHTIEPASVSIAVALGGGLMMEMAGRQL